MSSTRYMLRPKRILEDRPETHNRPSVKMHHPHRSRNGPFQEVTHESQGTRSVDNTMITKNSTEYILMTKDLFHE
jgi:hypothetical protein